MKKWTWFTLLILWTLFIFSNSLKQGIDSSEDSAVFVNIALKILNFLSINIQENTLSIIIRKTAHYTEYFILGIFVSFTINNFLINIKMHHLLITSIIIVLVIACIDELIQCFVPGRSGQILDVLIDFFGGVCAIFLMNIKKLKTTINNK